MAVTSFGFLQIINQLCSIECTNNTVNGVKNSALTSTLHLSSPNRSSLYKVVWYLLKRRTWKFLLTIHKLFCFLRIALSMGWLWYQGCETYCQDHGKSAYFFIYSAQNTSWPINNSIIFAPQLILYLGLTEVKYPLSFDNLTRSTLYIKVESDKVSTFITASWWFLPHFENKTRIKFGLNCLDY